MSIGVSLRLPRRSTASAIFIDGSASLVKGDLLDLIREELSPEDHPTSGNEQDRGLEQPQTETSRERSGEQGTLIPIPAKRLARVRLSVRGLSVE